MFLSPHVGRVCPRTNRSRENEFATYDFGRNPSMSKSLSSRKRFESLPAGVVAHRF